DGFRLAGRLLAEARTAAWRLAVDRDGQHRGPAPEKVSRGAGPARNRTLPLLRRFGPGARLPTLREGRGQDPDAAQPGQVRPDAAVRGGPARQGDGAFRLRGREKGDLQGRHDPENRAEGGCPGRLAGGGKETGP